MISTSTHGHGFDTWKVMTNILNLYSKVYKTINTEWDLIVLLLFKMSRPHTLYEIQSYMNVTKFKQFSLPLAILTATTVVASVSLMPYASARTTMPNAPWPSLGPTFTSTNCYSLRLYKLYISFVVTCSIIGKYIIHNYNKTASFLL